MGLHRSVFKPTLTGRCRPVQLYKWLLVGNKLYNSEEKEIAQINCKATWKINDTEPCAVLAQETLTQGHSVLIFCCSKKVSCCLYIRMTAHTCN